jgi:peptidoglycan/xylan/chitin deacetylase (PgdA/CDA1 family)
MPRWNWTWEDHDAPGSDAGDALPHPPEWISAGLRSARRPRAAQFGAIAVVALALQILFTGGGHHARAHATVVAPPPVTVAATAPPHTLAARETRAIDAVLARMPAITEGGPHGHEVALTFDDGPGPYSEHLVETLHRLRVPATFFAIGVMEQWFSPATRAELRDGDVVGDHTQTHPFLAALSPAEQRLQLLDQAAEVEQQGAPFPRLFRPPYGSFDAATLRQLRQLHMLMVLWSTDTSDYTLPGVRAIVRRALQGAHPGAIILLHDAGGNRVETIAALPAIVRGLRRRGLTPVTIPRLLLDDPPTTAPPLTTRLAGD